MNQKHESKCFDVLASFWICGTTMYIENTSNHLKKEIKDIFLKFSCFYRASIISKKLIFPINTTNEFVVVNYGLVAWYGKTCSKTWVLELITLTIFLSFQAVADILPLKQMFR